MHTATAGIVAVFSAPPRMRCIALCALIAAAAACPAGDGPRTKKLIATGWDHPDSARLREHRAAMEKRPFDGVVIQLTGDAGDGKRCRLRAAFADRRWEQEWFRPCVENLRKCRFEQFTDNFVTVGANPGNVDWFDEDGWANIVEHWRIAAWIASAAGCRGILFDPEPYTPPHAQFRYGAQPGRATRDFAAYRRQARRRGRAVMRAVAGEYPGMTLFCYFMNSVNARAAGRDDPVPVLRAAGYGLLPAFIDGWLDELPAKMTLVDGCESAYRYNSATEYLEAFALIKGACRRLVSPENRSKYGAQVQAAYGIYLDAYWNPKDSEWGTWYIDGKGESRVTRLRKNLATALRLADEYVWVYGEKYRWWPTPNGRVRKETWPEALPGCEKVLRFCVDPDGSARAAVAAGAENLARNGSFDDAADGKAPAAWSTWQDRSSKGTLRHDPDVGRTNSGAARAAGVSRGCFLQACEAAPGELYAVRAWLRSAGRGDPHVRVRWQTVDGAWTASPRDRLFFPAETDGAWREIFGTAAVPAGAGKIVILLNGDGQETAKDAAWYDDVGLYRIRLKK